MSSEQNKFPRFPSSPEPTRYSGRRMLGSLSPFPSPLPATPGSLKRSRPRVNSAVFASPVKNNQILSKDPVDLISNEEASDIFHALDPEGRSAFPSPRFKVEGFGGPRSPCSDMHHGLSPRRRSPIRFGSPLKTSRVIGHTPFGSPRTNHADLDSDDDEFVPTLSGEDDYDEDYDDCGDDQHHLNPTDLSFQFDSDNAQSRSSFWDNPLLGFHPARPQRDGSMPVQFRKSVRPTSLGAFTVSTSIADSEGSFSLADINERMNSPSMKCRTKPRTFVSPVVDTRHKARVGTSRQSNVEKPVDAFNAQKPIPNHVEEPTSSRVEEPNPTHVTDKQRKLPNCELLKPTNSNTSVESEKLVGVKPACDSTPQTSLTQVNSIQAVKQTVGPVARQSYKPGMLVRPRRRNFHQQLFPVRKYGSAQPSPKQVQLGNKNTRQPCVSSQVLEAPQQDTQN